MTAPLRQVFLDTETTGREVKKNHRIVEIGLVEVIDSQPTGRTFHTYLNPVGAIMDPDAQKVHGLSMEFLSNHPQFSQIASDFIEFIRGAEVLIHNSAFDEGFLNAELAKINQPPIWQIAHKVVDTLLIAQSIYPSQRNSLDALCKRLEIDNTHRQFHGALLDAQLLTDVYLKMTKGQTLYIDDAQIAQQPRPPVAFLTQPRTGILFQPSENDLIAHEQYLTQLETETKKTSVWRSSASAPKMSL